MKKLFIMLSLFALSTASLASNLELKKKLQAKFPNTEITSAEFIKEIPGLVELVVTGNKIIYTNKEGSLFVVGHIFDSRSNVDITQARIDSLTSYSWNELPFNDAIKVVKGNGKREFAVFSDPSCPFCVKLEKELQKITNYTMYVFPTPFRKDGQEVMGRILCDKNPAKSWTNYMQNGISPTSKDLCKTDSILRTLKLASKIGVSGTPSLLGKNGKMVPGYMPAEKINKWLNSK